MSGHAPRIAKEIPAERWPEWCDILANGNRGRSLSISLADDEFGAETPAERVLMVAIDRDPIANRNDLVVFYGDEQAPTAHVVSAPVSLWQVSDANGAVVALQIEDQDGQRTILSFD